jgi:GntR family transcriptional regulator
MVHERAVRARGLSSAASVDIQPFGYNLLPMKIDKGDSDDAAGQDAGRQGGTGNPPVPGPGEGASPIEFRLDPASGVPTYLQLVQQVEHALRLGYLRPGDQLPRVRDVVASLAINPNTVLKAYRQLEYKGLAAGRPGQGTFIEGTLGPVGLPDLTALRRSLLGWLGSADALGLDEDGMVALFTSALRDFRDRTAETVA